MATAPGPREASVRRMGAICIIAGTLIFAAATLLHPPTLDPRAADETMADIITTPFWSLLHWAMVLGVTLLGIGLVALHGLLRYEGTAGYSLLAMAAWLISIPLWIVILVMEAAGGSTLAAAFVAAEAAGTVAAAELVGFLWASILALGYVAAVLQAAAVGLWGLDLLTNQDFPTWFAWLGIAGGVLTGLVVIPAWLFPSIALFLLIPPAAALFVWFLGLGWLLWEGAEGG